MGAMNRLGGSLGRIAVRGGLCLLLAATLRPARAADPHNDDLRIGMAALATSVDPHFYNLAANISLALQIFDPLVLRTADSHLAPGLAESWKPLSDTVWEFQLRPGVSFHDGQAFTADDVAFTIARAPSVPNSPSSFAGMLRAITQVDIVGPLTLHLHTRAPAPNLPGDLAIVAVVSRHAGEGASSDDYNSGKAAIGTGPYRFVRFVRGERVLLARNDAAWRPAGPWANVAISAIPNAGARVAALLAGDVDIIDVPPLESLPQLRADKRIRVSSAQGLRLIFLGPDHTRDGPSPDVTDQSGQPLPRNPLRDLRVRQALSIGISRQALAERVMNGGATPTAQWMPAGTIGHVADIKVPDADPDRARALLAEAGFPKGFHLVLHAPNDRYPNDAATAQAIAQMWTRIGVQTEVNIMPGAVYAPRGVKHEFAMGLWGWSNGTGEAGYALLNVLGREDPANGRGVSNVAGYANPALDALTDRALATLDPGARTALLEQAVRMATDDVAFIPLFHLVNAWASRADIAYDARADEQTWASLVRRTP